MILYALLIVAAAYWLGWIGWRSSKATLARIVTLCAGLSIAGASMLTLSVAVAFTENQALVSQGYAEFGWAVLAVTVPPMAWLAFGTVALTLADSPKTRFQIVGLGMLGIVLGPLAFFSLISG